LAASFSTMRKSTTFIVLRARMCATGQPAGSAIVGNLIETGHWPPLKRKSRL
jgi:hypothetical protein